MVAIFFTVVLLLLVGRLLLSVLFPLGGLFVYTVDPVGWFSSRVSRFVSLLVSSCVVVALSPTFVSPRVVDFSGKHLVSFLVVPEVNLTPWYTLGPALIACLHTSSYVSGSVFYSQEIFGGFLV